MSFTAEQLDSLHQAIRRYTAACQHHHWLLSEARRLRRGKQRIAHLKGVATKHRQVCYKAAIDVQICYCLYLDPENVEVWRRIALDWYQGRGYE